MEIWLKIVTVTLWSSFKFIVGVLTGMGLGLSFLELLISTLGGGVLGVLIYLYLWEWILKTWRKFYPKKLYTGGIIINNRKRFLVKIIKRYEVYGIAFLTPILLSVPVGTLMAASIEHNKFRIVFYMFLSFSFWFALAYGLYSFFGIKLDELF
jgi:hypothetical protein